MPQFSAGFAEGLNDISHRAYEGANTQWLLDALTAAKHKRDLEDQQRQQLIRDQIVQGQAYEQMSPPPQSPPPGAASQPMQAPQAPPAMPPGGPPMGPGGPPNLAANFPPGTAIGSAPNAQAALAMMKGMEANGQKGAVGVQPPTPAGWQPSPGASPALGGPGGPPASAAPPPGQIAPPPMGGAGPEASQPGVIPGQMLSVPKAIETLKGMHIPPDQIERVLDKMMPAINAQNKQAADAFKLETNAQKAAIEAYKAYILGTQRAETQAKDVESKVERRASGAAQGQEKIEIDRQKLGGAAGGAAGKAGAALDPETLNFLADRIITGDKSAATGLGYGNAGAANRAALQRAVRERADAKGLNGADIAANIAQFGGVQAGERTAGVRSANIEMAVTEADKMADLVTKASEKVGRSQFVPLNKAIIAYEEQTGDVDVRKLGASINSFINAYARAISPAGVPTVADKEHARDMLKKADTHEQMVGIIDQLHQEMKAAQAAPPEVRRQLREAVTGKSSAAAVPTATNPKTGEKVEYRDGKWQPVKP